jgi:hypothetical protein
VSELRSRAREAVTLQGGIKMPDNIEYYNEVSVTYRYLDIAEEPIWGEKIYHLYIYHHPTQIHFCNKLAVRSGNAFHLINQWNRQPKSGWQFYIE